ncbi:MAG: RNA degradosome polyphosphate kinase [Actinobacteria bacterium]|nr:RNA degradosome polyphosphate kinase [Actinomycetota bacterium]
MATAESGELAESLAFADGHPSLGLADSPNRFINRELSWLDFNARVLALAEDPTVPMLERAKFLAIFSSNLDEFFQVRVAGLKDQVAANLTTTAPDGRTAPEQLLDIRDKLEALMARQEAVFLDTLVPGLAEVGIIFSSWNELDEDDVKYLDEVFEERIFPVLTPLAVDPGHPFPYISDLSLNLAVEVHDVENDERRFARVKVPLLLPRFVVMPDGERFVPLEQVIAAHLDVLFPGMSVVSSVAFRVTRNADLTLEEEEADDLLEAVELELRRRRFGRTVRLEIDMQMSDEIRELLQRELDVEDEDVYAMAGPLDLSGLWSVHGLDRPDLKDPVWVPVTQHRLVGDDDEHNLNFFAEIRKGDILVHHPYESFATSVEEFIRQASVDPKVLAIKLTLYRTTKDSSIIHSLIRAAERGKQVAALVELKARFDEEANIEWARELEKAGVHVVYGLVGLKTHTKTTLVVREESVGMRRYCHIGTGNYNPKTARLYEDVGLLTCDPDIGADLTQLFNFLTGFARDNQYRRLFVAPAHLRNEMRALIEKEAQAPTDRRLVFKMNSLVDPDLIDALYEASQSGVSVDLIVRGICCLRPGVPGLSENIRVRSIVGRYLEHSRIYYFGHGAHDGGPAYYMGSADLMPRNLDRRIEALAPVLAPELRARLDEIVQTNLGDDSLAWTLDADGNWHKVQGARDVDTHKHLQDLALSRRRA